MYLLCYSGNEAFAQLTLTTGTSNQNMSDMMGKLG